MIVVNNTTVMPTIFPDGTSQVWKLNLPEKGSVQILWDFQHEAEVFHMCQLLHLLEGRQVHVRMPFLPYSRQDKDVSDDATFSLRTLGRLFDTFGVNTVTTIDAHSDVFAGFCFGFVDMPPTDFINQAIDQTNADAICYPDLSAYERYHGLVDVDSVIVLKKTRDQATGNITGMAFEKSVPEAENILIVDDICDGGRTFCEAAKLLKNEYPEANVDLYVTHGIFSKGLNPLYVSGISTVHTMRGPE